MACRLLLSSQARPIITPIPNKPRSMLLKLSPTAGTVTSVPFWAVSSPLVARRASNARLFFIIFRQMVVESTKKMECCAGFSSAVCGLSQYLSTTRVSTVRGQNRNMDIVKEKQLFLAAFDFVAYFG